VFRGKARRKEEPKITNQKPPPNAGLLVHIIRLSTWRTATETID
jgi:hypothetical protein